MTIKFSDETAGYGFINFANDQTAVTVMHKLNGKMMPNTNPPVRWRLNHSSNRLLPGEKNFSVWVGDLTPEVCSKTPRWGILLMILCPGRWPSVVPVFLRALSVPYLCQRYVVSMNACIDGPQPTWSMIGHDCSWWWSPQPKAYVAGNLSSACLSIRLRFISSMFRLTWMMVSCHRTSTF